jgi:hypothetical protein
MFDPKSRVFSQALFSGSAGMPFYQTNGCRKNNPSAHHYKKYGYPNISMKFRLFPCYRDAYTAEKKSNEHEDNDSDAYRFGVIPGNNCFSIYRVLIDSHDRIEMFSKD